MHFKRLKETIADKDATSMGKKTIARKIKKRRWDAVLIGTAMSIAFAVILMRFTGYWPCEIISTLNIENMISCSRSPQDNLLTIYTSIQQGAASIANLTR
jgi:hypothetical protein